MKSYLALLVCLFLSTLSLGNGSVAVAGPRQAVAVAVESKVDCEFADESQGPELMRMGLGDLCKAGCKLWCDSIIDHINQENCRRSAYHAWLQELARLNALLAAAEPNSAEWDSIYKQIEALSGQGPDYSRCR